MNKGKIKEMTTSKTNIDPSLNSIPEAEYPAHLHGRIMKRVFFAGYGRYLFLSSGVLFLNLGVLGHDLWRTAMEIQTPDVILRGLAVLPTYVFVILAITAAATVYAFHIIWNLYKEYKVFAFARNIA